MTFWKRVPLVVKIAIPGGLLLILVGTLKSQPVPNFTPVVQNTKKAVTTVEASPSTHTINVISQGTVEARREIELVAEVSGRIVAVDPQFVSGGFFNREQVLIRIDDRDYQVALLNARARVAEAEQNLAIVKGQARQARHEWRDLDNAEANDLFLRRPQLAAAKAQLLAAKGDLAQAEYRLERTRITVPFDGRIRKILVDLGQYVNAGTQVAVVYDTSVAQIRLPLSDRDLTLLELPFTDPTDGVTAQPKVQVFSAIGGNPYTWTGRVVRTEASVDTRTRLYYAIAEIENPFTSEPAPVGSSPQIPMLVGMFVKAAIQGRPIDNVIRLPRAAVFKRDQVYVLDNHERIIKESVKVLYSNQESIWVQADLAAHTQVVAANQTFVSSGMAVEPKPIAADKGVPGREPVVDSISVRPPGSLDMTATDT